MKERERQKEVGNEDEIEVVAVVERRRNEKRERKGKEVGVKGERGRRKIRRGEEKIL